MSLLPAHVARRDPANLPTRRATHLPVGRPASCPAPRRSAPRGRPLVAYARFLEAPVIRWIVMRFGPELAQVLLAFAIAIPTAFLAGLALYLQMR